MIRGAFCLSTLLYSGIHLGQAVAYGKSIQRGNGSAGMKAVTGRMGRETVRQGFQATVLRPLVEITGNNRVLAIQGCPIQRAQLILPVTTSQTQVCSNNRDADVKFNGDSPTRLKPGKIKTLETGQP